jgi:hypothetical protein
MSCKGKNGKTIGDENVRKLQLYLERLRHAGDGLPGRGGKVNISAVAMACGFNREVVYQNPHCRRLLDEAVTTLGFRGLTSRSEADDAGKAKLERRLNHLEQHNAALVAEVHELRRQLTKLRHIEEMVEAGKRVIF